MKVNKLNESKITSTEPVVKFKGKSAHTFTKDKKWEVDFDEEGNILARTRHGNPSYFKGHINDEVSDFPSTDEDNIILAAREQHKLKFDNSKDIRKRAKIGDARPDLENAFDVIDDDGNIKESKSLKEDFASITSLADDCGENTFKISSRDIRFRFNNEKDKTNFINKLSELKLPHSEIQSGTVVVPKSESMDESKSIKESKDDRYKVFTSTHYDDLSDYGYYVHDQIPFGNDKIHGLSWVEFPREEDRQKISYNSEFYVDGLKWNGDHYIAIGNVDKIPEMNDDERRKQIDDRIAGWIEYNKTNESIKAFGAKAKKLNESEDYKVKFFQVFEAPKSPKENGKMIGQRGTLEDANAFGKEKIGEGNYIIKAVCDDGKTRPIDNDTKASDYKMEESLNENSDYVVPKDVQDKWGNQPILHDEDQWEGKYKTFGDMWAGEGYKLEEASYGGAFDIADDEYFTRDDINEFAYEVCEHLNEIFPTFFDIVEVYMDNGVLDLTVQDEEGTELNSKKRIDMRKIKKPSDLNRAYVGDFVYDIRKQYEEYYSDGAINESVDTDAIVGPTEGAEFGLSELINTAIQNELATVSEYNTLALNARSEGFEDIALVIEEINTEENKHIGQLQELLKTVSPNASAIDDGKAEGEEQLSNPVPQE